MPTHLKGQEVTIHFLNGASVTDGVLEDVQEQYVTYRTEYEQLYIPISAIRAIAVRTKERRRQQVGFAP